MTSLDLKTLQGSDFSHPVAPDAAKIPLVVDLDGTLSKSDTLHEALLALVAKNPMRVFRMTGWLKAGKAAFKNKVAEEALVDVTVLPLRAAVIEHIQAARKEGREVHLVSASHQKQVDAVAEYVGLFDSAKGSEPERNLAGSEKAAYLVERFGERGFDYIGDSGADLDVWPQARRAITAGAKQSFKDKVAKIDADALHLDPAAEGTDKIKAFAKAMRPHQWLKNMLVFVPALAAHDLSALVPSFFAFVAFCLAASSIYLINDMLDLEVDRRHPRKRNRPFAAGLIPVKDGAIQAAVLFGAAMVIALLVAPLFLAVLAGYVFVTFAYSLVLKRKLMIDVWTLGALYTIRIIGGAAATAVPLSEWLLAFSMFLFLSLAGVKRMSELADLKERGLEETDGRGYRVADMPVVLGVVLAAGYCSVLVLALYISSAASTGLYGEPRLLWLVAPLLLYWISRATMISFRGEMDDDPIVFALKDTVSRIVFVISGILIVLSAWL
ncbi:MAG: UbiA family prenyltransferase [Pseudomonadota bacterium]